MLKNCSLDEFINFCRVSTEKKVIIFGASKMGETVLKILRQKKINVSLIFDNDLNKNNKKLNGINIVLPYENKSDKYIVLISSMYYKEIYSQLEELSYKDNVFYIKNICNMYNYLANIIEENSDYVEINSSSILMSNFKLTFDKLNETKHLKIGKNSVLDCEICYQKNTGLVTIGDRSYIANGTKLICVDNITVGDDVLISWDCTIYDNDSHSVKFELRKNDVLHMIKSLENTGELNSNKEWKDVLSKPIVIKDKAWIGFGVTILKGVTIGEGSIVGARSVVTKDVPSYCVVAGNPARVVKKINKSVE